MKEAEDRREQEDETVRMVKARYVTLDRLGYYCIAAAFAFWIVALVLGFGFGL